MKTNNKVLILLLIVILAVSGLASGVFAAGGQSGDPKPTLTITKFRPKEATEYSWDMAATFSEWAETVGSYETDMELLATRTMEKDDLQLHIEADLSVNATDALILDFGYTGIKTDEDGVESEGFVSSMRFEDVSYTRLSPTGEAIKFDFVWENIDRSLFDDPETDDDDETTFGDVEGINQVRVVVPYVKSRGNIGEVTASKELGLEEHEAYGFVEIQSNFQAVLEEARSTEEPSVTVDCTTSKTDWLLDMDVLPLGEGDTFLMQARVTTDDPTALENDLVQFLAYPYMENNEEYHVWDGVDWDENVLMAVFDLNFPVTADYETPSSDTSLSTLTVSLKETATVVDDNAPHEIDLVQDDEDDTIQETNYSLELPVGADLVNYEVVVTATANTDLLEGDDPIATVEIVPATMVTRLAVITVTAENGDQQEYRVDFSFEGSNLATLSDLTVGEVTIVDFDPTQLSYQEIYPELTTPELLPAVAGVATNDPAAIVTYPGDKTYNEEGFPVTKYVMVTAEDQTTILTYSVLFAPEGWTSEEEEEEGGNSGGNAKRGSKLKVLAVDNEVVEGFSPDILNYDITLDEGTLALPVVTTVAEDAEATVQHIKPTRLPGQYKLKVTVDVVDPVDETLRTTEETIYILEMDVEGLAEGEFIELATAPLPAEMMGLWLPPTDDNFFLTRTSTQIRFWTSNSLLAPKLLIFKDEGDEKVMTGESTPMVTISTSDLKSNSGNGKHSRTTVDNGDGGYYKYNLKGRNLPNLNEGESYILALYNGDQIVEFQPGQLAMLHFTMGEQVKGSVDHRNRDLNVDVRSSNSGNN